MSHILPSFLVIKVEGDSVTLPWAADVEVSWSGSDGTFKNMCHGVPRGGEEKN